VVHQLLGMLVLEINETCFCAGDMLVEDVKLTLGSALAFNDLPTIKRQNLF
jgi:hypothetical protein